MIDLTEDIDYTQATYYETGGKAYYSFLFENYDTEIPHLQLETTAKNKTSIKGTYTVDLTMSSLDISEMEQLSLTSASLTLTYVGLNGDLDPEYEVSAVVTASNGEIYRYHTTISIYAYDADDEYNIIYLDETQSSTALDQLTDSTFDRFTKIIKDGHLYILRGGKKYTMQGAEVK